MSRHWIRSGFTYAALGAVLGLATVALAAPKGAAKMPSKAAIERGRYLVSFAACSDCHTPMKIDPVTHAPAPDMNRMFSGQPAGAPDPRGKLGEGDQALIGPAMTAFALPFGTVYAANLTPDRETGLGTWTEDMFVQAMRTGKHLGQGRAILPPMPWYGLATLTDADLAAVFAYLRSVPAVHNPVPEITVPPPVLAEMAKGNQDILEHLDIPRKK